MSIDSLSSNGSPATRMAILEACWRLLEKGTPPAMTDVAAAADVSRQALYLHFENRAALLLATMEHIRSNLGVTQNYARILEETDPERALAAIMQLHAAFTPRVTMVTRAFEAERLQDPVFETAWQGREQTRLNLVRSVVTTIAKAGRLKRGWSVDEATDWLWSLLAPGFTENLMSRGWTARKVAKRTHEAAIETLLTRAAEGRLNSNHAQSRRREQSGRNRSSRGGKAGPQTVGRRVERRRR